MKSPVVLLSLASLAPLLSPAGAMADAPTAASPASAVPATAATPAATPPVRLMAPPLPSPAPAAAPRAPRRAPPRPKAPPTPAGPVPDVRLTIEAPTTQGTWRLRVTNAGDVPVRLAADARLLSLEVVPRGESKPIRCELPADMRPADDLDRSLVLPPGRSYAETFEPRLYCFGGRALQSLAAQSMVTGRLGWSGGSGAEDRQAVSAIDGIEPAVASIPSLVSPPIALPDELSPALLPAPSSSAAAKDVPALRISSVAAVDAVGHSDMAVTVTLRNDGTRPVRVRFKPETLAFDVITPVGSERCPWPVPVGAPMRELFSTLPAHGAESLTVALGDFCSTRTFERSGLIVVRPELDTRKGSGAELGLQTFDGQVIATVPTVVRLHRGSGKPSRGRPALEPASPPRAPAVTP